MELIALLFFIITGCAHHTQSSLDFYEIGNDIHREVDLTTDSGRHDVYIPPRNKTIVVILGARQGQHNTIVRGLQLYYRRHKAEDDLRLKIFRGKHNLSWLVRAISNRKVHGIITDLPRSQMKNFIASCREYHVPILHLSARRKGDSYLIRSIYPNFQLLLNKTVREMKKRNLTRIAVLSDNNSVSSFFHREAEKYQLRITRASYQRDDFSSMSHAVQRLFDVREERIDLESNGEQQFVYRQLKKYDAVFLPADFKALRYFSKIFSYYNLERIPLVGLHHWRSPKAMTSDSLLQRGFFVDFIGNYHELPNEFNRQIPRNLEEIKKIDLQLIGYRGLQYLTAIIDQLRLAVRSNLNGTFSSAWQKKLERQFITSKNFLWQPQVVTSLNIN